MSVLTDRLSLRRAFFRLTGVDANNTALTEHDGSTLETLYQLLQYGLWDAQAFLIDCGMGDRWVKRSSTLSFSGSDTVDGGKYTALPSDFLRLAGDDDVSALCQPDGSRWGRLVEMRYRGEVRGNFYYLMNDRLYLAPSASPPSNLVMEYHHKLATLVDTATGPPAVDGTVDFPEEHRALIVAYAADRAQSEAWLPGDLEMNAKIAANLDRLKKLAWVRARRNSGPRKMRARRVVGTHWLMS